MCKYSNMYLRRRLFALTHLVNPFTELLLLSHDTTFIRTSTTTSLQSVQTFTRCFRCTTASHAFWKHLRYTTNSADSQLVIKFGIQYSWVYCVSGKNPKWLVSGSAQRLLCIRVHNLDYLDEQISTSLNILSVYDII